jgi:hypothetical protein
VLASFSSPGGHAAGLNWSNGRLWHIDGRTRKAYRLDPSDGTIELEWEVDGADPTAIVVHDGKVFVGDWNDTSTYVYSVDTGVLLETRKAPLERLWGATSDGQYFWFVAPGKKKAVCVEADSWHLFAGLPVTYESGDISGIAFDGEGLWVAHSKSSSIKRHRIRGDLWWHTGPTNTSRERKHHTYENKGPGTIDEMTVTITCPPDMPHQSPDFASAFFSPLPDSIEMDEDGQWLATFTLRDIAPGDVAHVSQVVPLTLVSYPRFVVLPDDVGTVDDIPESLRSVYTVDFPGSRLTLDDPALQQAASEAVGSETNVLRMIGLMVEYIHARVIHNSDGIPEAQTAAATLQSGRGDCDDWSWLLVAMCRLNGIPAGDVVGSGHWTIQAWLPGPDLWYPVDSGARSSYDTTTLWEVRSGLGTLWRAIRWLGMRPGHLNDWYFWPEPDPSWNTTLVSRRVINVNDKPNSGPLWTGSRESPVLVGNAVLQLQMLPAFDPEGDVPVEYRGYLTTGADEPLPETPTFSTEATAPAILVSGLPVTGELYLQVIPYDALGNAAPEHLWNAYDAKSAVVRDFDADGLPDEDDSDADGDRILNSEEGTGDPDGDGRPNYLDRDSDGDTLPDITEGTTDPDGDGLFSFLDPDSDNDTLPDRDEGSGDWDGDGLANYLDPDSDNDGVPDWMDNDPLHHRMDVNGDGVVNAVDIQLVTNEILGIPTGHDCDLDYDGRLTAVDVQLVINGVLSFR